MKVFLLYTAIFALALLLIPMLALDFNADPPQAAQVHDPGMRLVVSDAPEEKPIEQDSPPAEEAEEESGEPEPVYSEQSAESFLILNETTGVVEEVSLRDFVRGAVAAEMPASFHTEALKAQAVAAHTYALHNRLMQQENPDPELLGADFSADPENLKVYITEAQAREFYGGMADVYWSKICAAADSVMTSILEYDDQPIVAAYHAISSGRTEDASNVWEGSAPYLTPANSSGDLLAPDYESEYSLTSDELREKLITVYPDMVLDGEPSEWFAAPVRSESGYVTEIEVGGVSLHGKDIRELMELRSHNFDVEYIGGEFIFHVYGYGHGVGLSQNGADYMARQGAGFEDILANYYSGATLKELTINN